METMFLAVLGAPPRGLHFSKASEPRRSGFMRLDARRAEHDDGVADALSFQLDERMDVLGDNADGAGGSAGQEFWVFVRSFRGVLGLWAISIGHGNFLQSGCV